MQQISVPEHNDLTLFLVCAEVFVMARLGVVSLDSSIVMFPSLSSFERELEL